MNCSTYSRDPSRLVLNPWGGDALSWLVFGLVLLTTSPELCGSFSALSLWVLGYTSAGAEGRDQELLALLPRWAGMWWIPWQFPEHCMSWFQCCKNNLNISISFAFCLTQLLETLLWSDVYNCLQRIIWLLFFGAWLSHLEPISWRFCGVLFLPCETMVWIFCKQEWTVNT